MRPLLPIDRPPSRGATVLDTPIQGASPPLLRARDGRVLLRRRGRHADLPRRRQHRRHRQAGRRVFVSLHVLVPGDWTVQRGHDTVEEIETALRERLPYPTIFTHLEPAEDPRAFQDTALDRDDDDA
jgi:hypothetical protein